MTNSSTTKAIDTFPRNILIVGCGGVASWLLPVLVKLAGIAETKPNIILMDGDKLETRNLDRQLFDLSQVGQFKATALADKYKEYNLRPVTEYLGIGYESPRHSLIFCCADNHAARCRSMDLVDDRGGRAIIGGNEYTDSDAYLYEPEFAGTSLDPRVYFPELLTDKTGDPTTPVSCQGEAAVASPQLVLANFSAANHMLQLFWFHHVHKHGMTPPEQAETRPYWPIRHANSAYRFSTDLIIHKEKAPTK